MFWKVIFLSCVLYIGIYCKTLPDYIKKCSQKDPKFNECALRNARDIVPRLLQGDKAYNMPSLVPLRIPLLQLVSGDNLHLDISDITIDGIETLEIEELDFDILNGHVAARMHMKVMDLKGTYNVTGKILVLPITGTGPGRFIFAEPDLNVKADITLDKKNGKMVITKIHASTTATYEKVSFEIQNLFNGDERLGAEMNKFLNENWSDVLNEFGQLATSTISTVAEGILSGYLEGLTVQEMFAD